MKNTSAYVPKHHKKSCQVFMTKETRLKLRLAAIKRNMKICHLMEKIIEDFLLWENFLEKKEGKK